MAEHKLFTFMKDDNRVYIASLTLEDAISALHELENISNVKYDVKNYSTKHVNIFPILNLDETYSDLPYILTEHQYKVVVSYLFDHKYPHLMTKKVVDKSEVKNCDSYNKQSNIKNVILVLKKTLNNIKKVKNNTAIPINTKMDKMDNAISRIDKVNNEYKIPLKNKPKVKKNDKEIKLDQSLNDTLNNLKNDTMDVLMKYMHQFNNKETRDNICNDLTKLLTDKYSNLMNDIDEVEEKNKNTNKTKLIVDNALLMLQNKIKGED